MRLHPHSTYPLYLSEEADLPQPSPRLAADAGTTASHLPGVQSSLASGLRLRPVAVGSPKGSFFSHTPSFLQTQHQRSTQHLQSRGGPAALRLQSNLHPFNSIAKPPLASLAQAFSQDASLGGETGSSSPPGKTPTNIIGIISRNTLLKLLEHRLGFSQDRKHRHPVGGAPVFGGMKRAREVLRKLDRYPMKAPTSKVSSATRA